MILVDLEEIYESEIRALELNLNGIDPKEVNTYHESNLYRLARLAEHIEFIKTLAKSSYVLSAEDILDKVRGKATCKDCVCCIQGEINFCDLKKIAVPKNFFCFDFCGRKPNERP